MKTTIDSAAVAAIASAALFNELCPDGKAGKHDVRDPDPRWPEDHAALAVGIAERGNVLDDNTVFGAGFAFGLQAGARIGANPLDNLHLTDLIDRYAAVIREAYKDAGLQAA